PLGRCVDAVAGPGGSPGDRRDVDDVAAAVLELVEEHLGGGDRTEQVDLDHLPVVRTLTGVERTEQHDAGIVDQDTGCAQLLADAVGGGNDAVAIGDVRFDGDGPVAQFVRERGDAIEPAGQQGDAVAVCCQGAGGCRADAGRCAGDDGDLGRCAVAGHRGQASGICRPKLSRVMASGSGPPRLPVSSLSMAATSSVVSSKSNTSKFSAMRWGLVDFGMTERPSCRCQRSMTCAGLLEWDSAILTMAGSSRVLVCSPSR